MNIELAELCESLSNVTHDAYMHLFLWLVILDIASGTVKAFRQKVGNSNKGLKGLLKHLLIVSTVVLANVYLPLMGYDAIASWFLFFFMIQYGISIVENWGQIGLPLPERLKNAVYKLNDKYDGQIEQDIKKEEDWLK